MSILLSVATPYCATQVSDMQLTAFADGQPLPCQQRKSIAYSGENVRCLVGWVGLATIGNHNTGDWLRGQLDAISLGDPPLETFINALTVSATLHFATLSVKDRRCEFDIAGWFRVAQDSYVPFSAVVSNYEHQPWKLSPAHRAAFHHEVTLPTRRSKHHYVLSVSGYEESVKEMPLYFRGLRGLLKRGVGAATISRACRQIARRH